VCLTRGWAWGGTMPKYQVDAFGQYLTNNLALLDALMDSLAAWLTRGDALPPADPDREAILKVLADARDGIAATVKAADAFKNADARTAPGREAMIATLRQFTRGLQAVHAADAALRELADRHKSPAPDAGQPPTPVETPALAGPTDEEKAQLQKVRAVAEDLKDEGWAPIQAALQRFAAVAEQGLQTATARAAAQELLGVLAQTADFIAGLRRSKSAYPEHVAARQTSLAESLKYLEDRRERRYAYSRLRRTALGDTARRDLDAGPLSPDASKGLLRATAIPSGAFANVQSTYAYYYFHEHLTTVITMVGRMRDGPPKDLTGQLTSLYSQFARAFLDGAEEFGKAPQDDAEVLSKTASALATCAGDLDRLIRADGAIKAVAQYLPARAGPMYADLVRRAEGLLNNTTPAARQERSNLDLYFQPFQDLAGLRLPDAQQARLAETISGGTFRLALTVFGKQMTQALTEAARGSSTSLDTVLEPRPMFRLLRRRAVAEAAGLPRVNVADLDAFSMSDKMWKPFVAALDENLRRLLGQYAKQYGVGAAARQAWQELGTWDTVYGWTTAAQHLTAQARAAGGTDLDALLWNLAVVSDPSPPEATWFGWAVGFHAAGAAGALAAGLPATAGWHTGEIHQLRLSMRLEQEFTAAVFDPPK